MYNRGFQTVLSEALGLRESILGIRGFVNIYFILIQFKLLFYSSVKCLYILYSVLIGLYQCIISNV